MHMSCCCFVSKLGRLLVMRFCQNRMVCKETLTQFSFCLFFVLIDGICTFGEFFHFLISNRNSVQKINFFCFNLKFTFFLYSNCFKPIEKHICCHIILNFEKITPNYRPDKDKCTRSYGNIR